MTFTADFLKFSVKLPSDKIGMLLSMTGFSGIIISPVAGFFGDRYGRTLVFIIGAMISIVSINCMVFVEYSYFIYMILFLAFGTGAATAWTCLNTMAVENSPQLRKPVTSVYNTFKFSGYALSPVILSFVYHPLGLSAVQIGCVLFIVISILLTFWVSTKKVCA